MATTRQIKQKNIEKINQFDKGSVLLVILKVSFPIVIMLLFNALYTMIDTMLSSKLVDYGNDKTGATSMGAVIPMVNILFAFPMVFSVSGGLSYTQSIARNDYKDAIKKFRSAFSMIIYSVTLILIIELIIGIPWIITTTGNWGPHPLWGDQKWKITIDAYAYASILMFAFYFMQINQLLIRILRVEKKGGMAALIPILSLPVNIGLDYIFMSPNLGNLGLKGAALATFFASIFSTLILFLYIKFIGLRKNSTMSFRLFSPSWKVEKSIIILLIMFGVGSFTRRIFDGSINSSMAFSIDNLSLDWHIPMTAMTRSMNMEMTFALGIAQTVAMLISYYYNNKNRERFTKTIIYGWIIIFFVQIIISLLFILIQEYLFYGFNAHDKIWISDNIRTLRISYSFLMFYSLTSAMQLVPTMVYSGTKKYKLSFIHSLVYGIILLINIFIGFGISFLIRDGIQENILETDLILFLFIFIGSLIGSVVVIIIFYVKIKEILAKSERLKKLIYN